MKDDLTTRILFDRLFRHQIYLEGIKRWFADDYYSRLERLYSVLATALFAYRFKTMDQFTKAQLSSLLSSFNRAQTTFYDEYRQRVISLLEQFVAVDFGVLNAVMETDEKEPSKFMAVIFNDPVPANGLLVKDWVSNFFGNSTTQVNAALRQGWANNWSLSDTLQYIGGTPTTNGMFDRFDTQFAIMAGTLLQHSASIIQEKLGQQVSNKYLWVSVMDDRTTAICRSRNGQIYEYGKGPLPPAHYGCRSTTVPLLDQDQIEDTFAKAIQEQPDSFRNDAFNSRSISSNSAIARTQIIPLTISQFKQKLKFIIGD